MDYTIQTGSSSISIQKIQQCLNRLNPEFQLNEDGYFNQATKQALQQFQASCGLEPDGILSSFTWDKLILKIKTMKKIEENIPFSQPSICYGSTGLDVLKIQQYLNQIQPEFPISIDGCFGAETQIKVIRFQNMCGLNPDGRVNLKTWDKLIEYL